ncbi:hypothetical protein HK405_000613, partial [Cladochytrium tenue]
MNERTATQLLQKNSKFIVLYPFTPTRLYDADRTLAPTAVTALPSSPKGWNLDRAADAYFQEAGSTAPAAASKEKEAMVARLVALFERFREADGGGDVIGVDGTEALCEALDVAPDDIVVLVLAWHLGCVRMCEFGRQGWIDGWSKLGCDTLEKMKDSLSVMRAELDDPAKFREVYQFTFGFGKQQGQKSM